MTLGELYDAVAYLGFETALEDEVLRRGFYAVLGRAIERVERLSPRIGRAALSHIAPRELHGDGEPRRLCNGETLTVDLPEGATLAVLSLFGEGSVTHTEGETALTKRFASQGETLVSFSVKGAGRLSVTAEHDVTLGAIGVYDAVSPLGEVLVRRGVRYDLSRLCPDFASFASPALYLDGRAYTGSYELLGRMLTLPKDAPSGLYEIRYRLAPPDFSPSDSRERELPLSPALASLLPELVASLLWLDDAPEKAAYYASVYERGYARLRAEMRDGRLLSVDCPNGW